MRSKELFISSFSALLISGLVMGSVFAERYEPLPQAKTHYKQGIKHSVNGNVNGALNEYLAAIKIDPNFAEAYNNIGYAYRQKGNVDLAIDYYNKALNLNPKSDTAYTNLASCYDYKKDYDTAIEMFYKALDIDPGSITIELALEKIMKKKASCEGKSFEQVKTEVAALYPQEKAEPSYNKYLDLLNEAETASEVNESENTVYEKVEVIEEVIEEEQITESATKNAAGNTNSIELINIQEIIDKNVNVETEKSNKTESSQPENKVEAILSDPQVGALMVLYKE